MKLDSNRFNITDGCHTMMAVVTIGNGGYEQLDYREVPIPVPAEGEVLLQVLAAEVNNTEINTRLGWYSSEVTQGTDAAARDQGLAEKIRPLLASVFPLAEIAVAQKIFLEKNILEILFFYRRRLNHN